ncbi:Uncharacterised protein [Collinsella aerofaciens]|uniref:Uncharacterized protein n=1 Tax=Collinsella aerofaciens TaxID=74426 RepID=A0A6N3DTG0_9ACTN
MNPFTTPDAIYISRKPQDMRAQGFEFFCPKGRHRDVSLGCFLIRENSAIALLSVSKLDFLKFRNRGGNMFRDASGSESQSHHASSDAGRIHACYNAGIRDENTVPVG